MHTYLWIHTQDAEIAVALQAPPPPHKQLVVVEGGGGGGGRRWYPKIVERGQSLQVCVCACVHVYGCVCTFIRADENMYVVHRHNFLN